MKESSQISSSFTLKLAVNPPHLSLEDLTTTLDRLTNIKHLTDQIDSVESKLWKIDILLETNQLKEIEQILKSLDQSMHIIRDLDLFWDQSIRIKEYQDRISYFLTDKINEASTLHDLREY